MDEFFDFQLSDLVSSVGNYENKESEFDRVLMSRWQAASDAGVCRYQLTNLKTKILPGKYGFVAQLNVERAKQRRQPQDLQRVNNLFNPNEFNFNKVPSNETLVKPRQLGSSSQDDNSIIINVSPLEFGNSLLVPVLKNNIPQMVTLDGLELLVKVLLLSTCDRNLRAGFNSPGGYASVNHQHYHLYYLKERLFLENVKVEHLSGPCYAVIDFPSKGFAFQYNGDPSLLAKDVFTLVCYLRLNEIAHNLFLTRGKSFSHETTDNKVCDTLRVFVWAREPSFGVKEEIGFNPALCELAGHLLIKDPFAFETFTEEEAAAMLEEITLPLFRKVRSQVPLLYPESSI